MLTSVLVIAAVCTMAFSPAAAGSGKARMAVLDFRNDTDGEIKDREVEHLTKIVRGGARKALPFADYDILTKQNIHEMLPPDTDLRNCVGQCAVETGRLLAVEYIVSGEVVKFADEFRVNIELYEIESGNLLKQSSVGAVDLLALEEPIIRASLSLCCSARREKVSA